jgi:CheY-like chemotaxis protein
MGSATLMRGSSILVVEDEPLIKLELTELFESAGAQVIAVSTCQQGLTAIGRHQVSAALLDYVLWEGNVAPLCRRLAELRVPFMFYTGYLDLERSYPRSIIIQKPAAADVLLAAMAGLMGATGQQSAAQSASAIGRLAEEDGLPRPGSGVTTRFDAPPIEPREQSGRTYREVFSASSSMAEPIRGTIVFDEVLRRKNSNTPRAAIPTSIKVGTGARGLAGSSDQSTEAALRARSRAESDPDA